MIIAASLNQTPQMYAATTTTTARDFSRGKGAFFPPENSFSPLDYVSIIKLILIYKNHKIYRLAVI